MFLQDTDIDDLNIYNWYKEYCDYDKKTIETAWILCNLKNLINKTN